MPRESLVQGNAASTAAVILNYRTPRETIRAVRSLSELHGASVRIVVVDNASGDGSPAMLAGDLPGIDLVCASHNGGFSAGCNLGIRRALETGARRVLLLNSDAVARPEMLPALEGALDADARLGIVGPLVLSLADPDCVQSAGISYSMGTARMRHNDVNVRRSATDALSTRIVDGVSGCAMLIRREVFERIGLFAEEYFFGFEDLDYCLRARGAGFLTACVGGASVLHEGNLSIGRTSKLRAYFAARNHLLLAARFGRPFPLLRWARMANVLALNLAFVATTSELARREGLAGFASGVRDYFAGRFGAAEGGTNNRGEDAVSTR